MSLQAMVAVMNAVALDMDIYERSVLIELANCAAEDGTNAWPAVGTLAARGRMSENRVRKALRALEDKNVIRPTTVSQGRRPTVYALNLGLLERHKRGDLKPLGAGAPDFDGPSPRETEGRATPHAVKGWKSPTLHRGASTPHRVGGNPSPGEPEPVQEPVQEPARPGARDPDGRAPGRRREGGERHRAPIEAGAGLEAAGRIKIKAVEPVRSRAFDIWAGLVAAIVARREAEAVRTWVAGPGVVEIAPDQRACVVFAGTVGRRAREALEPILQRHGWRVVEAGTAWAGEGVAA